ncbi:hypothetical protein Ancab_025864 [Ancistrocladus abbreviatus]
MSMKRGKPRESVPFSWEVQPGITKHNGGVQEECSPKKEGLYALKSPISMPSTPGYFIDYGLTRSVKIPPPPCPIFQARSRSLSMIKRLLQPAAAEDPFLAALRECTRNVGLPLPTQNKRSSNILSVLKRSKFVFSCKQERDVREDGLVKLSDQTHHCQLPPLPRERSTPES